MLLTQCGEAQHMDSSLSWLGEWSSWEWEFLHSSASIPCCFYSSLCIPQDIVLVLFLHCCSLLLDTQHLSFLQFAGFTLCVLSSLMSCTVGAECCVWQVFVRLKDLKGQKCVQSFRPKDYLEAWAVKRVCVCVCVCGWSDLSCWRPMEPDCSRGVLTAGTS